MGSEMCIRDSIYGDIMIVLNIVKAVTRKVTVRILRRERTFGESPQG